MVRIRSLVGLAACTWLAAAVPAADVVNTPALVNKSNRPHQYMRHGLGGTIVFSPAASSWGPEDVNLFVVGRDSQLWHKGWGDHKWSEWEALGNALRNTPTAVSWGPNRIDVVAITADSTISHIFWDGVAWSTWAPTESVAGATASDIQLVFQSDISMVSYGPNNLQAFVTSADSGRVYHNTYTGTGTPGWGGWMSLGGILISAPVAISLGPCSLFVFALGPSSEMFANVYTNGGWSTWNPIGTQLFRTKPTAVSSQLNTIDLFAVGLDSSLYQNHYDGANWGTWQTLGGVLESPPVAFSGRTGHMIVYATGTDSNLWALEWSADGQWRPWRQIGGPVLGSPAVVPWVRGPAIFSEGINHEPFVFQS